MIRRHAWQTMGIVMSLISLPCKGAETVDIPTRLAERVTNVWNNYAQPAIEKLRQSYPEETFGIARVVIVMTPVVLHPTQHPFSKVVEMRKEEVKSPDGKITPVYAVRESETLGWAIAQIEGKWKVGTLQVLDKGMKWHTDMHNALSQKELERIFEQFNPPTSGGVKGAIYAIPIPERREPKGIAFAGSWAAGFLC